ncbi:MAG: LLM class flavin-dependent oxidoreductase [Candidatus Rokubacteria bacterium]|nr:LLM class flavin-dependent oxidoreductase [Candidatus Rokubacteria bacterium]
MTFGIHIGHLGGPLAEMRKLWRFADDRGFDWFSIADHFQESPPQGGDLDCFESTAMMAAAAIETRRVRIGSLVYSVSYRHPAVLASTLTSIDHLSGGRLECGFGAGWHEGEYRAFGIPFPSIGVREDQLEEFVQVLRLLFDPAVKRANFSGKYFQLVNAPNNPKPLQPHLRIFIGGSGEKRTLRAVARYADGWNAPYLDPAKWQAKSRVLDDWCDKEGRDPRTITRTVNVGFYMGADAKSAARAEAMWERHWANDAQRRRGFVRGTPKEAIELVAAYREAGVERLNIAFRQGPYDWDALAAFAEEVMPAAGATG